MEKSLVNDQTSEQKLPRKLDRVKRYRAPPCLNAAQADSRFM